MTEAALKTRFAAILRREAEASCVSSDRDVLLSLADLIEQPESANDNSDA